jgi:hypothetical protein
VLCRAIFIEQENLPNGKAPLNLIICHCGGSLLIAVMEAVQTRFVQRVFKECDSYEGNEEVCVLSRQPDIRYALEMGGFQQVFE